jgi:hypothetical protein
MLFGPGFDALRPAAVPQQKLAEPVRCFQLILFRRLTRAHQIPQRLMPCIAHPHRRQFSGA